MQWGASPTKAAAQLSRVLHLSMEPHYPKNSVAPIPMRPAIRADARTSPHFTVDTMNEESLDIRIDHRLRVAGYITPPTQQVEVQIDGRSEQPELMDTVIVGPLWRSPVVSLRQLLGGLDAYHQDIGIDNIFLYWDALPAFVHPEPEIHEFAMLVLRAWQRQGFLTIPRVRDPTPMALLPYGQGLQTHGPASEQRTAAPALTVHGMHDFTIVKLFEAKCSTAATMAVLLSGSTSVPQTEVGALFAASAGPPPK